MNLAIKEGIKHYEATTGGKKPMELQSKVVPSAPPASVQPSWCDLRQVRESLLPPFPDLNPQEFTAKESQQKSSFRDGAIWLYSCQDLNFWEGQTSVPTFHFLSSNCSDKQEGMRWDYHEYLATSLQA